MIDVAIEGVTRAQRPHCLPGGSKPGDRIASRRVVRSGLSLVGEVEPALRVERKVVDYFETIAELEHLGRAAERVHRSPPALTKGIRRLEESLGTPLFERVGRGLRLTAAGRALQRRAKLLDVAIDDTLREVGAVAKGAAGHLRIGVAPTMAQYLLPGACNAFLENASTECLDQRSR